MNIFLTFFMFLNSVLGAPQAGENPNGSLWNTFKSGIHAKPPTTTDQGGDTVPQVTGRDPQPDAPVVKGVYVTAYSAGGERMASLLNLLDKTELNSMVIDIKDDLGNITYKNG